MDVSFDMINSIMQWVVLPIAYFVWMIYQRQGQHHTDIAVLKAQHEANKLAYDREMKEMKETIRAIFQKLDTIEQALRKQGDDVENLKLPIVLVAALGAQLAAAVFWGANVLRDISDNSEKIDLLLEVLVETEDDLMLVDEKLQEDLDENTIKLVNEYYTRMIQMEGRINSLENTLDYLLNSSRYDDGR